MAALGHKQPLNILAGERLVSGVYRPLSASCPSVCFRPIAASDSQYLLALVFDFRPKQITKLEALPFHFLQPTTFVYLACLPIKERIPDGL